MLNEPFYIYRHIRPDTNEVFYIGKGNNLDKRKPQYFRAFETRRRNNFWVSVFEKNNKNIKVDILFCCMDEAQANVKEIEFIKLYGRRDLGQGTLTNLTDGGDGSTGLKISEETRAKLKKRGSSMQGKKHSKATLLKLSIVARNRTTPNPFKGKTHTEETKRILSKRAKEFPSKPKTKFININTNDIYSGLVEAAKAIGIHKATLSRNLRNNYQNNHTPIMYYDDYINGVDATLNKGRSKVQKLCKKVIDKRTNKIYQSVKDASVDLGLDVSTLRRRLNGVFKNNTSLEYYAL